MAGKHLGKAYLKMDGKLLESMPGATLDLGGDERQPLIGANAVLGYTEKPKPALLDCKIALGLSTRLEDFRLATNVTITFEADTGQAWNMANAWLVAPPVISDGDGGHIPLKFAAKKADQV
jgi:hypothetical protein